LNRSKPESTTAPVVVSHNHAAAQIENPPTKAGVIPRADPAHRQPLGSVSNQAVDHHRPADFDGSKPSKTARMDNSTVTASVRAPAAAVEAPGIPKPDIISAVSVRPSDNLAARRKELASFFTDIDSSDVSDPMFCSEYVEEVYDYLRDKEVEDRIDPNYMIRQNGLTPRMRMVLIDWMVEVQLKFRMTSESLYLSVNIVDKYLQKKGISRERLQLLGVTALHIASKFEEVYSVDINDFVFICDNSCTSADIISFEGEVLRTIHWSLTTPCALHFLRRYSKAVGSDGLRHTMSKYLTELSLGTYGMLKYLPSTQAAAAVFLTRCLLGSTPYWPNCVQYHSGYSENEILECARAMHQLILHPDPKFRLVTRKYSGTKFCGVAQIAAENAPKVQF